MASRPDGPGCKHACRAHPSQVVLRLKQDNMLPCIWFILSRKDCDMAVLRCHVSLVTDAEREAIAVEVAALR